jgi:hypothetical protein
VSDRLSELQRQRGLLREHLAWLEREIAAEAGGPRPAAPLPLETLASAPVSRPGLDPHEADAILAQYSKPPTSIATQTKAGCILYFVVGIALLAVAGTGFYFLMTRMRGH